MGEKIVEPRHCAACGDPLPEGWSSDCCGDIPCKLELTLSRPKVAKRNTCIICGEDIRARNARVTCGNQSCQAEWHRRWLIEDRLSTEGIFNPLRDPWAGFRVVHVLSLQQMTEKKMIKVFDLMGQGKAILWKTIGSY